MPTESLPWIYTQIRSRGFFDIPVDHLTAFPVLAQHVKGLKLEDTVIVSPDVGNLKTASRFTNVLGGEIAVIDKRRQSSDKVMMTTIIGNIEGKNVLLFDDMIATGGTLAEAAKLVRARGAKAVYAGATHPVFSGPCIERLQDAGFSNIWVTDTIPLSDEIRERLPNLEVFSVARVVGEAIRRIHEHQSISALFSTLTA